MCIFVSQKAEASDMRVRDTNERLPKRRFNGDIRDYQSGHEEAGIERVSIKRAILVPLCHLSSQQRVAPRAAIGSHWN